VLCGSGGGGDFSCEEDGDRANLEGVIVFG